MYRMKHPNSYLAFWLTSSLAKAQLYITDKDALPMAAQLSAFVSNHLSIELLYAPCTCVRTLYTNTLLLHHHALQLGTTYGFACFFKC